MQKKRRIVNTDLIDYVKTLPCVPHLGAHQADDADHLEPVGRGGHDIPENLLPTCRGVHSEKHSKGLNYIAEKYPSVKTFLIDSGWGYDQIRNKWTRHNN